MAKAVTIKVKLVSRRIPLLLRRQENSRTMTDKLVRRSTIRSRASTSNSAKSKIK